MAMKIKGYRCTKGRHFIENEACVVWRRPEREDGRPDVASKPYCWTHRMEVEPVYEEVSLLTGERLNRKKDA
jgi:hypothetical protein